MMKSSRRTVLFLFFASGVSGLVYEVVWARLLTAVFGNTVFAVAAVLAAFMGGLALGSFLAGRLIDRRADPLRVFGLLEIVLGPTAFYLTVLLTEISPFYVWLHRSLEGHPALVSLVRYAMSFCLLVIPATLMGATLPVLSRFVARRESAIGLDLGSLYALNTLGAAAGCYAAGFVLIGSVGVRASVWLAAALNVAVGLYALYWHKRVRRASRADALPAEPERVALPGQGAAHGPAIGHLVLAAIAASGFAGMGYEVLWTRALVFFLGNSVYAFSAMLTTFLVGLAAGSFVMSRWVDQRKRLLAAFGLMESAIGFYGLLSIYLFAWSLSLDASVPASLLWQKPWLQFLKAFGVMFVPTFLFGATFPVAARIYVAGLGQVGRNVGRLYAFNTLGGIAGAAVTGFALLPTLGLEGSLAVLFALNLVLGVVLCACEPAARWRTRSLWASTLLAAAVLGLVLMPRNVFIRLHEAGGAGKARVVAYREDAAAAVCVAQEGPDVTLLIDNLPVAGTAAGYLDSQKFLGHLPILVHPHPRSVFVLGFGAGGSCYSASTHPEVERIDSAELCPGVAAVAHLFLRVNHNILASPNFSLTVNDGRNVLLTTRKRYDVISVDLLFPQSAGAGSLYTEEFYKLCKRRLKDRGIMVEWVSPHLVSCAHLRIILRTLRRVFPHTALWHTSRYAHMMLVASEDRLSIDYQRLLRGMTSPAAARDLAEIHVASPYTFLSYFVGDDDGLGRLVQGPGPINTDDLPLIEYGLPLASRLPAASFFDNLAAAARIKESVIPRLANMGMTGAKRERALGRIRGREHLAELVLRSGAAWAEGNSVLALKRCREALALDPAHLEANHFLAIYESELRAATRQER